MSLLTEEIVRNLISKVNVPVVLREYVNNWQLCSWDMDKWRDVFGDRDIPFRCMTRDFMSDEPCWERLCKIKSKTFQNFLEAESLSEEWMYFDYKYVHQWFAGSDELFKAVSWEQFGYPDKGPPDSTLWIGSQGAHTPAHQDTYGVNVVAQVYGKKRWILFPPETDGLRPTRVPYEESSVYSELNFYCPANMDPFNGLSGGRLVELSAGDALVVPRGWWHYVQNLDPINITLNIWLPHEKDKSTRVSEALVKIFVAQLCKDLPPDTARLVVNPNEDDVTDTPLTVLFLQLETVAKMYLDSRRKLRRAKRQRTREDESAPTPCDDECDIQALIDNPGNNLEVAKEITSEELINILKDNVKRYVNVTRSPRDDEVDSATASLCLTKAVIDAFSHTDVMELVKQKLLARLG